MIIDLGYGMESRGESQMGYGFMSSDVGAWAGVPPGESGRRLPGRFVIAISLIMTIFGGNKWR